MEAKRQKREAATRQITESANPVVDAVGKENPIPHPILAIAKHISEPNSTAADSKPSNKASNTSKEEDFCFKGSVSFLTVNPLSS